jgi:hypothetical protein
VSLGGNDGFVDAAEEVIKQAGMPLHYRETEDSMTIHRHLIEYNLSLADISEASAREKNFRHGRPSTLHTWWARRSLASCRAIALAALIGNSGPDHPQ